MLDKIFVAHPRIIVAGVRIAPSRQLLAPPDNRVALGAVTGGAKRIYADGKVLPNVLAHLQLERGRVRNTFDQKIAPHLRGVVHSSQHRVIRKCVM